MDYKNPSSLISVHELSKNLMTPNLRVIDATSYLPGMSDISAYDNYKTSHIPGAVFFDIDKIADTDSELPHMLPNSEEFCQKVSMLGVNDGDRIIVYDQNGGFMSACRVWWMFKYFGFDQIAVLNGGFLEWLAANLPIESIEKKVNHGNISSQQPLNLVCNFLNMLENCQSKTHQVIDARSSGRFLGEQDEPRPGLRKGHIPGSINIPYIELMKPNENFMFKTADELTSIVSASGIYTSKPIIATCGSGITACVIAFSLHLIGFDDCKIYDGSWVEWGSNKDAPIAT